VNGKSNGRSMSVILRRARNFPSSDPVAITQLVVNVVKDDRKK
jgi:hypothetical protein